MLDSKFVPIRIPPRSTLSGKWKSTGCLIFQAGWMELLEALGKYTLLRRLSLEDVRYARGSFLPFHGFKSGRSSISFVTAGTEDTLIIRIISIRHVYHCPRLSSRYSRQADVCEERVLRRGRLVQIFRWDPGRLWSCNCLGGPQDRDQNASMTWSFFPVIHPLCGILPSGRSLEMSSTR